jgi:hypothetical protein
MPQSSSSSSSSSGGIGCLGLLGILFIALKLTGYIDWPWVWVLAPWWIGGLLLVAVIIVAIALVVWIKKD